MIIVLSICKILGILLLVLACILALILFVPLFYELDVDIDGKSCYIRVNWMFRLIRFRFRYHKKIEAVLSVLFFRLDFTDPKSREKRKKKKAEKAVKKAEKARKAYEKQIAKRESEAEKKRKAYQKKREKYRVQQQNVNQEEPAVESLSEQKGIQETKRTESSGAEADMRISGLASESVKKDDSGHDDSEPESRSDIREKLADESQKAKKALGMIQNVKDFLHKVSEYGIIGIIFPKLQVFLMRIRPRVLKGCIEFGMEDPAATGQIVGGIAMIPLFYQTNLRIIPDFEAEDAYIKGHVYTRGHILCIHVIVLIIQLIKEKNIRRFISEIRKKK